MAKNVNEKISINKQEKNQLGVNILKSVTKEIEKLTRITDSGSLEKELPLASDLNKVLRAYKEYLQAKNNFLEQEKQNGSLFSNYAQARSDMVKNRYKKSDNYENNKASIRAFYSSTYTDRKTKRIKNLAQDFIIATTVFEKAIHAFRESLMGTELRYSIIIDDTSYDMSMQTFHELLIKNGFINLTEKNGKFDVSSISLSGKFLQSNTNFIKDIKALLEELRKTDKSIVRQDIIGQIHKERVSAIEYAYNTTLNKAFAIPGEKIRRFKEIKAQAENDIEKFRKDTKSIASKDYIKQLVNLNSTDKVKSLGLRNNYWRSFLGEVVKIRVGQWRERRGKQKINETVTNFNSWYSKQKPHYGNIDISTAKGLKQKLFEISLFDTIEQFKNTVSGAVGGDWQTTYNGKIVEEQIKTLTAISGSFSAVHLDALEHQAQQLLTVAQKYKKNMDSLIKSELIDNFNKAIERKGRLTNALGDKIMTSIQDLF